MFPTTDVNWLDELKRLSEKFRNKPLDAADFASDQDAVITDLSLRTVSGSAAAGGRMTIHAAGKSSSVVPPLEDRLRDDRHLVTGRVIEQDDTVPEYPTRFELDIDVLPAADDTGEDAT